MPDRGGRGRSRHPRILAVGGRRVEAPSRDPGRRRRPGGRLRRGTPGATSRSTSARRRAGICVASGVVARIAPGRSPTTIANSPRSVSSPLRARSASSPSGARTISSWSFVSSRPIAPGRSAPQAAARSTSVAVDPARRLVEHASPRSSAAIRPRRSRARGRTAAGSPRTTSAGRRSPSRRSRPARPTRRGSARRRRPRPPRRPRAPRRDR